MKNITLEKISAVTGFSIKHVSRALCGAPRVAPESRRRICAAARELGYAGPHGARTGKIAVITPTFFHWALSLQEELARRGLSGVILIDDVPRALPEKLFDGAISICGHDIFARRWSRRFHLPLVLIHDYALYGESISSVAVDCDDEMRQAVSHLARQGHRKIVWLREIGKSNSGQRYQNRGNAGFYGAAGQFKLSKTVEIRDFINSDELPECLGDYCERGFTGFIINEFRYYHRLLHCFAALGKRIPGDVSLIVYDCDGTTGCYQPRLTTLAIDYPTLNRLAVDLLLDALNGNTEVRQLSVQSRLIIRDSTGVAPA